MPFRDWTPKHDATIRTNIGKRSYSQIAALLGSKVTRTDVWRRWNQLRRNDGSVANAKPHADESIEAEGHINRTKTGDVSEEISSVHPEIRSVEQLLHHCKVDLKVWRVKRSECGVHEGFYRDKSFSTGKKSSKHWHRTHKKVQMYAVKVVLERIPDTVRNTGVWIKELVQACKEVAPVYKPVVRKHGGVDPHLLLEVSIYDHHFGKLAWAPETGENYDLKIARTLYLEAAAALLKKSEAYPIEKILWVVGQDGLHTDNANGTTTAGTPQHCDGRWQKSFVVAYKTQIEAINMARLRAPVEVFVVPGNHDFNHTFFMGLLIAEHFRHCPDVKVNNELSSRKYFAWGKNLIGFTHGNQEKHGDLPALMAKEAKQAWANSDYQAWHIGHYHKRKETRYTAGDTYNGVEVRILPSLCATDQWHALMGYVKGVKAAEAYLWGKEAGYEAHFAFNPNPTKFVA